MSLAGRVIASHYAEPLLRHVASECELLGAAADDSEQLGRMRTGDDFWLLDDTAGWAWGYAGSERRVGYVRVEALAP